ncbi:hypothetical protein [Tenacibaculum haliotis]|uniref:hypothetical protein n=1 Tax=Tenacibaculum haliotis TaxID=1888914 RepID=UPI0021AF5B53|nr:hypothetical protein [Tenacibaculum haliotis]MCT4698363.1 hypothetical protein [Tenacibaculum haliotis]
MELTKEQIQQIDNRLKKQGIKYWDLRIEMVDHIVSDMETNATTNDFKVELEKTLRKLNWNGGLIGVNTEGWQNTNRKYRKEYHSEFIRFFKSFTNVFFYVVFSILCYLISEQISYNIFKKISLILFIMPMILFFIITTKQLLNKYGKSVNLDYGIFYFSFAFLMINLPFQFIKEFSIDVQKIFSVILLAIFYVATYAGYKTYKKALTRVENMKNELAI